MCPICRCDPCITECPLGTIERRPWQYTLDGHTPVPCDDVMEWAEWLQTAGDRHVAKDERDGITVSTVFLGLDYGLFGPPLLFETMVFGGPLDGQQERYSTWEEAEAGHRRWLARVFPPVEYVH